VSARLVVRICRKECITYAHTYTLDGILTSEFTRRRHAPTTAPRVVILGLEGGLPIRPDCDSITHRNGLPLAFVQLGRRVWPEVASAPRRPHK